MVQNSLGEVMAVQSEKIKKPSSVEILKMLAVRRVVQFVKEIGLNHSCFEGDSEIVVKALRSGDMFSSSFGHLFRDNFHVELFSLIL